MAHHHIYEVRPRKDKRGVDLISDALPFDRLTEGERLAADERIAVILLDEGGNTGVLSASRADSSRGEPVSPDRHLLLSDTADSPQRVRPAAGWEA